MDSGYHALVKIHEEGGDTALALVAEIMDYNARCTEWSFDQLYKSWLAQNEEIDELREQLREAYRRIDAVDAFFALNDPTGGNYGAA